MKLANPISRITTRVRNFRCWKAGLVEFDLTPAKLFQTKRILFYSRGIFKVNIRISRAHARATGASKQACTLNDAELLTT